MHEASLSYGLLLPYGRVLVAISFSLLASSCSLFST